MIYEYQFLQSLLLTFVVETAVLFTIARFFLKITDKRISNSLLFFTGFICSFATLPYLWFILPLFLKTRMPYVILGEFFVVMVESVIIFYVLKLSFRKSFIISFICNASSFLVGLIISAL